MTLRLVVVLLLGLLLAAGLYGCRPAGGGRANAASPELRIVPQPGEPGRPLLVLTGLPEPPSPADSSLFLTTDRPDDPRAMPVLGTVSGNRITRTMVFQPRVRLTPGKRYTGVWRGKKGQDPIYLDYIEPKPPSDGSPSVEQVYPPGERVPVNLLKFYIRFSRPMQQGKVFENVRLLDSSELPAEQAFHEQELWADDSRRLTLWINPGRTKQRLGLSDTLGPVLKPGREYLLEVGARLRDTSGRPLGSTFTHRFRAGAPDTRRPAPGAWRILTPPTGSREPVTVIPGEWLDLEMARSLLTVRDDAGAAVSGELTSDWSRQQVQFRPSSPWRQGRFSLVVPADLEDMCGNSIRRYFESVSKAKRPTPQAGERLIDFEVRPAGSAR